MKIYDYKGKKNICGPRLKEARKELKMTQEELSIILQNYGITIERDSISRIEIGTRFVTDYELQAFSEIFGHEIEWFLRP